MFSSSPPDLCLYFWYCLAWEVLPAFLLLWKGRLVPLLGIQKLIPAQTVGSGQHPDVWMDVFTRSLKGEKIRSVTFILEDFLIATCVRKPLGAPELTWKHEM